MKNNYIYFLLAAFFWVSGCSNDKYPLPQQTTISGTMVSDTTYLQLQPVWNEENGFHFNQPQDVLIGREPLIYVADTDNDRILMLDLGGNVLGESQPILHPIALTQDAKLNLLIANDTNKLFRINLVTVNHQINSAPVELAYEEVANPDRRYTGITAVLANGLGKTTTSYYVTAFGNDKKDNQILIFPEKFDIRYPNSVGFEPNGLGMLSVSTPSGITNLRDFNTDFIFCMIGDNSFKVQWITTSEFGFIARLNPAEENFDLLQPGKFMQPEDVTVDPEGNIFVIDAELNWLFKFSILGEEQQSFGGTGSGEKQFQSPHGVAFFNKTVYVADTGNNRIVRFKLSTDIGQ